MDDERSNLLALRELLAGTLMIHIGDFMKNINDRLLVKDVIIDLAAWSSALELRSCLAPVSGVHRVAPTPDMDSSIQRASTCSSEGACNITSGSERQLWRKRYPNQEVGHGYASTEGSWPWALPSLYTPLAPLVEGHDCGVFIDRDASYLWCFLTFMWNTSCWICLLTITR